MKPNSVIIGRDRELERLRTAIDEIASHGSAIVIDGDPGVGKTTVVNELAGYARSRGVRILHTAGTTAESGEQYAALHLLLHPLREAFDTLPRPQRDALRVAFGQSDDAQPTPLMAGLAALTLLSDAASETPLLIIADDMHWTDPESAWALRMIARRIGEDPIVVVMTTRERVCDQPEDIERLHLAPLDTLNAAELIDGLSNPPFGAARRTLLELAEGNPLALIELTGRDTPTDETNSNALTGRLEMAFAGRFSQLDQPTRLAVLAIALGDVESAEEASRLANEALGRYPSPSWTEDAISASLLAWSAQRSLRMRHPLVRSAILSVSRPSERAAVLGALVTEYRRDPTRTLWWRAELAVASDGPLSDELANHAKAGLDTGDLILASRAMVRAAELTPPGERRVARQLDAAEFAGLAGRTADATLLVHSAERDTTDPGLAARAAWVRETLPTGHTPLSRGDIGPALRAVTQLRESGATDLAVSALLHLAAIAWDHTREPEPGAPMINAVRALDLPDTDPRAIVLAAVTEPVGRGDEVIRRALAFEGDVTRPEVAWWLGYALNLAGEIDVSVSHLERAVSALREQGDIRVLPQALLGLAMSSYRSGKISQAKLLAHEALVLANDLSDVGYQTAARCCVAWFDAIEGTAPDLHAITAGSSVGANVMHSSVMRATFEAAIAASALLAGHYGRARDALRPLFDQNDDAFNPVLAITSTHDYIDAALLTGETTLVHLHLRRLESLFERWHAPIVQAATLYTRLSLLIETDPDGVVQTCEATPLPIPLMHARLLLRVGERLRTLNRIPDSRRVLHTALDTFETLPAQAWADRTRETLRTTGERLTEASPSGAHVLTPQELRICSLANEGRTNRAIAEQLFLSPRTVGAHLYSAYRKLGIQSRDELRSILGG